MIQFERYVGPHVHEIEYPGRGPHSPGDIGGAGDCGGKIRPNNSSVSYIREMNQLRHCLGELGFGALEGTT